MAGHDALNGHVLPDDEQMIARALGDEDEPDKSKDPMEEWGEEALDDDIEDIEDIEDINGATRAPQ